MSKAKKQKNANKHRALSAQQTIPYIAMHPGGICQLPGGLYTKTLEYEDINYSLDCDDGIEYSACLHEPTPQELLDRMELFVHLWNALNSLPEVQGVRVEAHLILGKSYRQIAREQGVDKSVVRRSVKRGMAAMKKYLKKVL